MVRAVTGAMLLILSTAAAAQVASIESANPLPKDLKGDQNRIICERVERTGSRLAVDKVCMTALEWKERRQVQREDFEKVQRIVNQEPTG